MPTGVALAYVCFYPFLDILFSSNSFDNLKKFFLLWIERKQPVPKDEKIVYFSDFDKQIDEQKSKVKELNDLFTASRTRSAEDVKRIELENNKNQEQFKVQVAWRITAECGGGVPLFKAPVGESVIYSGDDIADRVAYSIWGKAGVIRKFHDGNLGLRNRWLSTAPLANLTGDFRCFVRMVMQSSGLDALQHELIQKILCRFLRLREKCIAP